MSKSIVTKELYYLAGVISEQIWGRLPGGIQQRLSAFAGRLFESPVSRFLIRPYCKIYYNGRFQVPSAKSAA